jgi:hypothetical protein
MGEFFVKSPALRKRGVRGEFFVKSPYLRKRGVRGEFFVKSPYLRKRELVRLRRATLDTEFALKEILCAPL